MGHKKLVMGLPTYGRSIKVPAGTDIEKSLQDASVMDLSASQSVYSWEHGVVSYWHQELIAAEAGWETKYDQDAQQTYLWNESLSTFMSYDTPEDLKKKVQFINSKNLGGAMFWEMDDDPMIYPKSVDGHAIDSPRDGGRLFDAVLEELQSCTPSRRLDN